MRRVGLAGLALLLLVSFGSLASAELVQRGNLRVKVDAALTPKRLPRAQLAPVRFQFGARFISTNGQDPPQLRTIKVEINRHGQIEPASVPSCKMDEIQPATTANALRACRSSLVGEGQFSAKVRFTEQSPFPSAGKLLAFNGRWQGHPAILAHIYGTEPVATSYTIPFRIVDRGHGQFGTLLEASLPRFSGKWGYVTGISLSLGLRQQGGRGGYLQASCPAPKDINVVGFPLSRASFGFSGRKPVGITVNRSCKPR